MSTCLCYLERSLHACLQREKKGTNVRGTGAWSRRLVLRRPLSHLSLPPCHCIARQNEPKWKSNCYSNRYFRTRHSPRLAAGLYRTVRSHGSSFIKQNVCFASLEYWSARDTRVIDSLCERIPILRDRTRGDSRRDDVTINKLAAWTSTRRTSRIPRPSLATADSRRSRRPIGGAVATVNGRTKNRTVILRVDTCDRFKYFRSARLSVLLY